MIIAIRPPWLLSWRRRQEVSYLINKYNNRLLSSPSESPDPPSSPFFNSLPQCVACLLTFLLKSLNWWLLLCAFAIILSVNIVPVQVRCAITTSPPLSALECLSGLIKRHTYGKPMCCMIGNCGFVQTTSQLASRSGTGWMDGHKTRGYLHTYNRFEWNGSLGRRLVGKIIDPQIATKNHK